MEFVKGGATSFAVKEVVVRTPHAVAMAFVFLALLVVLGGCKDPPPQLLFVLGDDFAGTIKVKGGRPEGLEIRAVDGIIRFVVPDDGVVMIRQGNPAFEWHSVRAQYADGRPVPVLDLDGPPDEVGFFALGERRQIVLEETEQGFRQTGIHIDETWYYVGARKDALVEGRHVKEGGR